MKTIKNTVSLFDHECPRLFLSAIINLYKENNSLLSLRSLSKSIGISASSLSDFLNKKSSLSPENSLKIAYWLSLDSKEFDYFLTLIILDSSKDKNNRMRLEKKIKELRLENSPLIENEIGRLFKNFQVDCEYKYYIPESLTFRILVKLKSKKTAQPTQHFIDRFFSSERQVASVGYFFPNADQTFKSYLSQGFSSPIKARVFTQQNLSLNVEFDSQGFPSIRRCSMLVLDTNQTISADLIFKKNEALITEPGNLSNIIAKYNRYP